MEYYIPISRRLFEHQLWCEERIYSRFEAWLDLIQSARFEDTKQLIGNRFIEVKRGQILASLRFLAGRWQWSTKKVNSFLDLLIQDKMIIKETPKETGQTVITICNYDKYNSQIIREETEKKQQGNTKETLHKARLTALHAICLQIFRYLAQKLLEIRKYSCVVSIQANEKSGYASCVQSLCGIALRMI